MPIKINTIANTCVKLKYPNHKIKPRSIEIIPLNIKELLLTLQQCTAGASAFFFTTFFLFLATIFNPLILQKFPKRF